MKVRVLAACLGALLLVGCGPVQTSGAGAPPSANAAGGPPGPGLTARAPAEAGDLVYLPVEELAKLSTHVVRGEVASSTAAWNDERTRIITTVGFDVFETLKGAPLEGRTEFTLLGGEAEGIAMNFGGRPVFEPGEHLVVFLREQSPGAFILVGLQQGRMDVLKHPDTGEEVAVRSLVGIGQTLAPDGSLRALDAQADPAWLPLDTLRERVR